MTEHATAPDIRYPRAMRRVLLCLPLAAALLLAGALLIRLY